MKLGQSVILDEVPTGTIITSDYQARIFARMAWLDEQDPEFRALVHEVGLNKACQKTGRRAPV